MAENLFDIIYSGYSTPLAAEQVKAHTQFEQAKTQTALQELATQKATAGMMQKIWGSPLGPAAASGTDDDLPKLNMTAAYLMQTGKVQEAGTVMSRIASIQERQAQTRKDNLAAEGQRRQDLSQTAGAITDQSTYSAAFPSLMEKLGPDAVKLKLTGDFNQDQKKLKFLSDSGASWAQKASVADREHALQVSEFYKGVNAQIAQTRLDQNAKKIDLAQKAADRAQASLDERVQEDAKRDARAQSGVKRDPAKEYTQNLKVSSTDAKDAQSAFSIDPRTQNMDPNLQQRYAQIAAGRSRQIIADTIRKDPNADISYEDTLASVMDEMEKQGLFQPTKSGWSGDTYSYKAPKWDTGQGTPKGSAPSKPAAPASKYATLDQVQAAVKKGELTRDQGIEYARSKGWVK